MITMQGYRALCFELAAELVGGNKVGSTDEKMWFLFVSETFCLGLRNLNRYQL